MAKKMTPESKKKLDVVGIMANIIVSQHPTLTTLRLSKHLNQDIGRNMKPLTVRQKVLKFFNNDSEMMSTINLLLYLNIFVSFASTKLNTRLHFFYVLVEISNYMD